MQKSSTNSSSIRKHSTKARRCGLPSLQQHAPQPFEQLADVLLGVRQEIGQLDLLGVDAVEVAEDDLQGALEELHLALDLQEIALLEGAEKAARRRSTGGR